MRRRIAQDRMLFAGIAALALAAVLLGCSGPAEVRTETIEVFVPVAVRPPAQDMPRRPALPLAGLDSTSAPKRVMQAYVASVQLLMGYARELEMLLAPYADSSRYRAPRGAGGAE